MPDIDVAIPVGPFINDATWLPEALESVARQTHPPRQVVIIDDMSGKVETICNVAAKIFHPKGISFRLYSNPWRLGCSDSWNIAVAIAESECVFLMGADDWLEESCLAACSDCYARGKEPVGYYYVGVRYQPDGEVQDLACNAAMVTKELWKRTGGFPVEAGLGAPDAALLSIMIGNGQDAGLIVRVPGGPHYNDNVRRHDAQETARQNLYHTEIQSVRDKLTSSWKQPAWTANYRG